MITISPEWRSKYLHGWRGTLFWSAVTASAIFLFNFIVAILFSVHGGRGRATIYEGDCGKAKTLDTVLHLWINILSTGLLGASNYGMQVLSGPTRREIDKAHARRRWLDIGVLSVRNLSSISRRRVVLWSLLLLSSFPLHLFFNSSIFFTFSALTYDIYSIRPSNLESGSMNSTIPQAIDIFNEARNGLLKNLTVDACIKQFAVPIQTDMDGLLLVVEEDGLPLRRMNDTAYLNGEYNNTNPTYLYDTPNHNFIYESVASPETTVKHPFDWVCPYDTAHNIPFCTYSYNRWQCMPSEYGKCGSEFSSIDRKDWAPFEHRVLYCLARQGKQTCKVQAATDLTWAVVACNLIKVAVLFYVLFRTYYDPILTLGDALASFLSRVDETTRGYCLMSKRQVSLWQAPPKPQRYKEGTKGHTPRWYKTVSARRWTTCVTLYATCLGISIGLLAYGLKQARSRNEKSKSLSEPFGKASAYEIIVSWSLPNLGVSGLLSNVVVANAPQVIFSAIYYVYNSLFTAFFFGVEWSSYALQRKGLRVSAHPKANQRSTYRLQLPYRVSVPLQCLSVLLHWSLSQSIFLISAQGDSPTYFLENEFISCAYSTGYMMLVIVFGSIMIVGLVVAGFQKFKGGMPTAATCSAAISAACHPQSISIPDMKSLNRHSTISDAEDSCDLFTVELVPSPAASFKLPQQAVKGYEALPLSDEFDSDAVLVKPKAATTSHVREVLLSSFKKGRSKSLLFGDESESSLNDLERSSKDEADSNLAFRKVQWGVISQSTDPFTNEIVGHCSFSREDVGRPSIGVLYAGSARRRRHAESSEARKPG